MAKHFMKHHGGVDKGYKAKVLAKHNNCLTRFVDESLRIEQGESTLNGLANSKGEWGAGALVRPQFSNKRQTQPRDRQPMPEVGDSNTQPVPTPINNQVNLFNLQQETEQQSLQQEMDQPTNNTDSISELGHLDSFDQLTPPRQQDFEIIDDNNELELNNTRRLRPRTQRSQVRQYQDIVNLPSLGDR